MEDGYNRDYDVNTAPTGFVASIKRTRTRHNPGIPNLPHESVPAGAGPEDTTVRNKMGLAVTSTKGEDGDRSYSIRFSRR